MLFNRFGRFVQSRKFTLSLFTNPKAFLLYIVSSQWIELTLLATTLKFLFTERRTQLLTRREVVKATHGFRYSAAMTTKPIITATVNFHLSACCKEAFNFTCWSCSLEIGHDHIFKAAGLALPRCESTRS